MAGAGAGANQQGDLEMRLSFPAEDSKEQGVGTGPRTRAQTRTQATNMSAPPGRWSLTIRNQLPGTVTPGRPLINSPALHS